MPKCLPDEFRQWTTNPVHRLRRHARLSKTAVEKGSKLRCCTRHGRQVPKAPATRRLRAPAVETNAKRVAVPTTHPQQLLVIRSSRPAAEGEAVLWNLPAQTDGRLRSMLAKEPLRKGGSVICKIRTEDLQLATALLLRDHLRCGSGGEAGGKDWRHAVQPICTQEAGHIELVASRTRAWKWQDSASLTAMANGASLAHWIKHVAPLGDASADLKWSGSPVTRASSPMTFGMLEESVTSTLPGHGLCWRTPPSGRTYTSSSGTTKSSGMCTQRPESSTKASETDRQDMGSRLARGGLRLVVMNADMKVTAKLQGPLPGLLQELRFAESVALLVVRLAGEGGGRKRKHPPHGLCKRATVLEEEGQHARPRRGDASGSESTRSGTSGVGEAPRDDEARSRRHDRAVAAADQQACGRTRGSQQSTLHGRSSWAGWKSCWEGGTFFLRSRRWSAEGAETAPSATW